MYVYVCDVMMYDDGPACLWTSMLCACGCVCVCVYIYMCTYVCLACMFALNYAYYDCVHVLRMNMYMNDVHVCA